MTDPETAGHLAVLKSEHRNGLPMASHRDRWGHRIVVHYLPKYVTQTNQIEHAWWHLYQVVTRNHRCRSIDDRLGMT
jgi:hypothetical protein